MPKIKRSLRVTRRKNKTHKHYIVENIIACRTNAEGGKEYFLKWVGYDDKDNTWEPAGNINCPKLIAAFEAGKATQETEQNQLNDGGKPTQEAKANHEKEIFGFERGLVPKEILSVSDRSGKLMFLIKWKGIVKPDWVLAKAANIKWPQLVIKFYEKSLTWIDSDNE